MNGTHKAHEVIVGIDLGTTNSEIAVVQDGKVVVIDVEGSPLLPSVVGLDVQHHLLVGYAAKNQQILYPERTIASVKRKMGSGALLALGDELYSPPEISALILKKLKAAAEVFLGHAVHRAVITVPAYFSDAQRQATQEAGRLAGFTVERIINEPTAAALCYHFSRQGEANQREPDEKKVLVYDLGGGTFDVSVVAMHQEVVEVLSSHGNNHLGGDDFDEQLMQHIVKHIAEEHDGLDVRASLKAMARIKKIAEHTKIHLSDHPYCTIAEEYVWEDAQGQPVHVALEIDRLEYEAMIQPYIDETLEAVHIALQDAHLTPNDIDEVLLVGGSSRTPAMSAALESVFQKRARSDIHPDLCVAIGAAVQAAILSGSSIRAVLVDVSPYTFGTSSIGMLDEGFSPYLYVPIIQKNTPIPVTKSELFYTLQDFQREVEIQIYQGEAEDVRENHLLGKFLLTGLRKAPAGNAITIQYHLNTNGILQVTAQEKETGHRQQLTITNTLRSSEGQDFTEKQARIDQWFEEPASMRSSDPIETFLRSAESLLETLEHAEDKTDVIELITQVKTYRDAGREKELAQSLEALEDVMFYFDQTV